MLLSAMSVLVVVQSSSEIPEGLMNNPVLSYCEYICLEVNKIVGCIIIGKRYGKPLQFAGVPFLFLCILIPHINMYITISRHHKNMKIVGQKTVKNTVRAPFMSHDIYVVTDQDMWADALSSVLHCVPPEM